jgi:hypothetical protein
MANIRDIGSVQLLALVSERLIMLAEHPQSCAALSARS